MPVLINPPSSELGRATAILQAAARQHHVRDFPGPLSIKTVVRGSAHWKTESGEFRIDESSLLVLNRREPYSLTIDSRQPVSTLCVFFEDGLVESVRRRIVTAPEELVDQPDRASDFRFAPRAHAQSECQALVGARRRLSAGSLDLESAILGTRNRSSFPISRAAPVSRPITSIGYSKKPLAKRHMSS